jgi:hypothetical protein
MVISQFQFVCALAYGTQRFLAPSGCWDPIGGAGFYGPVKRFAFGLEIYRRARDLLPMRICRNTKQRSVEGTLRFWRLRRRL